MDGITDLPFRIITAKYGKPDVIFTEFIAVEALIRGIPRAFEDLGFEKIERPVVAQIYGKDPYLFYSCAQIAAELGFDGVDINMGCPAKTLQARGAGAGLIKTPEIAKQIIHQARKGLDNWQKNGVEFDKMPEEAKPVRIKRELEKRGYYKTRKRKYIPLSVKTRIGYDVPQIEDWIEFLATNPVDVISIHGRTLRQKYAGKADWDLIKQAASSIKKINPDILVIGNGDIDSKEKAFSMAEFAKVDGVLIARSSMGNPWVFQAKTNRDNLTFEEIRKVMLEHATLHWGLKDHKAFVQMRRNLASYIKEMPGSATIRSELVKVNSPEEVKKILKIS